MEKKCSICKLELPFENFSKDKRNKTGYGNRCKSCYSEYCKKRLEDPEKRKHRRKSQNENYLHNHYNNEESLKKDRERKLRYYHNAIQDELKKFEFSIRSLVRNRIKGKGFKKSSDTLSILGTTWDNLKVYFEQRFTNEMTWENYGTYWEIDHILPVNTAKTQEDIIRLNHYTNLQPLMISENRSKKDSITEMGKLKELFPFDEIKINHN